MPKATSPRDGLCPPTPDRTREAPLPCPSPAWPFAPDVNMRVFAFDIPAGEQADFSTVLKGKFMQRYPTGSFHITDAMMLARVQTDLNRMFREGKAVLFISDGEGGVAMAPEHGGSGEVPIRPPMVLMREARGSHKALVMLEDEAPYGARWGACWPEREAACLPALV